ncbi:MAG: HNH endonuclease signature motif containing protein [Nocardioidaceae bacterium]
MTDVHGEVLDVSRACRHTNTGLNKAIAQMYDGCAYPNFPAPVTQCDIHHVWWWSRGGPTDLWILMPLRKQHHLFVHEYGYYILTRLDPGRHPPRTGSLAVRLTSRRSDPRPSHHTWSLRRATPLDHQPDDLAVDTRGGERRVACLDVIGNTQVSCAESSSPAAPAPGSIRSRWV